MSLAEKQTNILPPSATNSHVTRLTRTQPPTVPSPTVTSSEDFIAKQLAVLQANLKKHFPQDKAAFHATNTKHTSSAAKSNTNHPKIDNCTDKLPPTPINPSKQHAGCTADKMDKLKKSLKQRPVRTNQISN